MQSNSVKKYIGIGLGLFALLFFIILFVPSPFSKIVALDETYELKSKGKLNQFYNKVDGYSILVPENMRVDMSMPQIRAVLENEEERIEIYHQTFGVEQGVTPEVYSQYSNKFLENEIDHHTDFYEAMEIGGLNMTVTQWEREPLKHVENDRNYYASVDIFLNDLECITFLFKSSKPYEGEKEQRSYMEVVRSLISESIAAEPTFEVIVKRENPSWNEVTREAYEKYFGEDAPLTWGIFEKSAPLDFGDLSKIEKRLEFQFPVLLYYTGFMNEEKEHPNLRNALSNAEKEERILELTLQTLPQENQNGNMVYDVLNGKYDEYLKNYVRDIKEYGKPVLFRVGNEMNGDWCVYSAYHTSKDTEVYIAFYRYLYSLFQEAEAENVIWIWNPNGKSFPNFKWNHQLCYFPGNEYVDVIGMTMYNTGTYYEGENWMEFSELYDELYEEYLEKFQFPLMITEFSSSSVGGDKEQWVQSMFEHIQNYKELKVAIWWSNCDLDSLGNISRPYFIDETDQLVEIFKVKLRDYSGQMSNE